jgi:hypothetical protein
MALTTGPDISGCCEFTIGYGNMLKFDSGKYGVEFDSTGGVDERIWGKDPTAVNAKQCLYVEYIHLFGCPTGGPISLTDGSAGARIVTAGGSDVSYSGSSWGLWDFKGDPLICITAEGTQSLCISSTINGYCGGFLKCWWGPPPK